MEGKKGLWIGVVAFGALATGVALYLNKQKPPPPEPPPAPVAPPPAPASAQPPLPSLAGSDEFVRRQAAALSAERGWPDWLRQSDLIRRFAGSVEILLGGKLPKDALDFLVPKKKFTTVKTAGKVYVDPKSYQRYDAAAAVIGSIDAKAAAALFSATKPLLDEACREIGRRDCDMQGETLRLAKTLLDVPEVDGSIRLKAKIVTWAMTDPALEGLSPAQKLLIRMGPKNGPAVQAKLRDFVLGLGASEAELPKPRGYSPKTD